MHFKERKTKRFRRQGKKVEKFWEIIGLVAAVLILGMILYNVYQTYLWQVNSKNDTYVFQDYKIEWKDENIELEIRMKLEKFNQDIYLSDIYDIRRLSLEGRVSILLKI